MIEYSYDPPYNLWSGNRSDTLNKWKINYKGSIATASALPEKGDFKGDTYNVLEDGSNYMWNGKSWDKLDANVYVGATSTKDGIQGLVPPAEDSERNKFLKGDATWDDVAWSMIVGKPSTFTPSAHTHDWDDIVNEPDFALDANVVHITGDETIDGSKEFLQTILPHAINIRYNNVDILNPPTTQNNYTGFYGKAGNDSVTIGAIQTHTTTSVNAVSLLVRSLYDTTTGVSALPRVGIVSDYSNSNICFCPSSNTTNLGYTSGSGYLSRWAALYAVSGTIQTSDERLKRNIVALPEKVLDAWGDVGFVQFQLLQSIEAKGDTARIHSGLIAQRIDEAFKARGLDASRYALFCHDSWDAQPEIKDEEGNIVEEAHPAGEEYSLRYDEALCMEAAYQRRRAERAETRIKALEDRLEALEAKLA